MIPSINLAGSFSGSYASAAYALWNSADKTSNLVLSNGDATADVNGFSHESVRSSVNTLNTSNGRKLYWEILIDALVTDTNIFLGLYRSSQPMLSSTSIIGLGAHAIWRGSNARYITGGWANVNLVSSYAAGDITMWALDEANGKLWTGKNGTWNASGDPGAGTNETWNSMPSAEDTAIVFGTDNSGDQAKCTLIADSADLTYSAPSGFTAGLLA